MERPDLDNSIFLVGPTASGKSAVGLHLAEMLDAEIISLDSMQLYRHMDIGTAKPTPDEQELVPHHLVDIAEPSESFSVARYVELAGEAVQDISSRGRLPLFVGGTALYLKTLVCGLFQGPSADWPLRDRLRREAEEHGPEVLHERLQEVDPEAAERIHPNDLRRIVRALEVYEKTGTPITELQRQWRNKQVENERPIFGLNRGREELYDRINRRVDEMMAAGFLDEVRELLERGPGREASQALGYRELISYLEGEIPSFEEAVELIKRNTRRFAKAQLTWFRSFPEIIWIDVGPESDAHRIAAEIADRVGQ